MLGLQTRADPRRNRSGVSVVRVLFSRPEEPAQSILVTTRHDVHMKMRNTLTDHIVDRDKRSIGNKCGRQSTRDALNKREERSDLVRRQLSQRRSVVDRHDEHMSFEQWRAIEEGDQPAFTVDEVGSDATGDDLTEHTGHHPLGHR